MNRSSRGGGRWKRSLVTTGIGVVGLVCLGVGYASSDSAASVPQTASAPTVSVTAVGDCTHHHTSTSYDYMVVTTTGSGLVANSKYSTTIGDNGVNGNPPTHTQYAFVGNAMSDAQGNLDFTHSVSDLYGGTWDVGTTYFRQVGGAGISDEVIFGTFTLVAGNCAGPTSPPPSTPAPKNPKVTLCHATPPATAKNGWNEITIKADAVFKQGHDGHDADIIPSFVYTDKNGVDQTFAAKNLSTKFDGATGQQILDNGCVNPSGGGSSTPPPRCVTLTTANVAQYGTLTWSPTSATVTLKQRDGGYCNDWAFSQVRHSLDNPPNMWTQTVAQVGSQVVGNSGVSATATVDATTCGQSEGYEGPGPKVGDALTGSGKNYEANHKFLSQVFHESYNSWYFDSSDCTSESTPPVSTPPVSTPPVSTPPVSTPPVSTPPVSTPVTTPSTTPVVPPTHTKSTTPPVHHSTTSTTPAPAPTTSVFTPPPGQTGDGLAGASSYSKLFIGIGIGLLGLYLLMLVAPRLRRFGARSH